MQKLLLVSIGPVQDFIATARRSRDLYFGSWMLSELSKSVAKRLADSFGMENLIFPAPSSLADLDAESGFNVANRVLVAIKEDSPPVDLDKLISQALKERLKCIRQEAFGRIKGAFDRKVANDQVDDLIEYYWVSVTFENTTAYHRQRRSLESLMAARKNTRAFRQPSWGDAIPKSSLDGQRESVLPETIFDDLSPVQLYQQYHIRPGERLSGVGLLKRHGSRRKDIRFFSTSHVAALPYLAQLDASQKHAVDNYVQSLLKLGLDKEALGNVPGSPHPAFCRYDGHILYPGRLAEFFSGEVLGSAEVALETFFRTINDGRRPQSYYALLVGDGDHIGKMIDAQQTTEDHRKFSLTLAGFADEVKKVVENHQGSLIYAGGDDVMAFLPVHTVLSCAAELSRTFVDIMKESGLKNKEGQVPTFSVGIAISHHLEPLADALTLARKAEHDAKTLRPEKNALTIAVAKRSGATTTVIGPWGELDRRIALFTYLHQKEAIPDKIGYELRDMTRRIGVDKDDPAYPALSDVIILEAVRLLGRKRSERGQSPIDKTLQKCLTTLFKTSTAGVAGIADELIVARLFAEVADLAGQQPDDAVMEVCKHE